MPSIITQTDTTDTDNHSYSSIISIKSETEAGLYIEGIAQTPARDAQGESILITKDAFEEAFPVFLGKEVTKVVSAVPTKRLKNVRLETMTLPNNGTSLWQHGFTDPVFNIRKGNRKVAQVLAGKYLEEENKIWVSALVTDPEIIEAVKNGANYFSFAWVPIIRTMDYSTGVYTDHKIAIKEITITPTPANKEAVFQPKDADSAETMQASHIYQPNQIVKILGEDFMINRLLANKQYSVNALNYDCKSDLIIDEDSIGTTEDVVAVEDKSINYEAETIKPVLIDKKAEASEEVDKVYSKYHSLVNMTASELEEWAKNPKSKLASISRLPIRRNLNLLRKNKADWTDSDIKEANKVISYISRASAIGKGKVTKESEPFGRNEIALRNWAKKI
jgi:Protein of unknown function (DUF3140)